MFDVLMTHILKRLEAFPDATFRESELVDISKKAFNQLVKDGYLEFDHYDEDGDSYFSDRIGDGDVQRTIRIRSGKVTAFSVEEGVSTIELAKPEITYYSLNLNKLIGQIYAENQLEEEIDDVDDRLHFIGSKDEGGGRVGVYFALYASHRDLETALFALPNTANRYAQYFVISPAQQITSQKAAGALGRIGVRHGLLEALINDKCQLKADVFAVKAGSGVASNIHFPGKVIKKKCIVKFGSQEAGLTEGNYKLLLQMALSRISKKDGWLETIKMVQEGHATNMMYTGQAIQRLSDDLKRSFTGISFDSFIESGGKKYRLVIPKDKISFNIGMLQKMKVDSAHSKIIKKITTALKSGTPKK